MKFLTGLALSFLLFSTFPTAQTTSDIPLKIGAKLPRKYIPRELNKHIATNTNQSRPYIEITIGKVDYLIAFTEDSHKIRYISTRDLDFQTNNGLKVGSQISVTLKDLDITPGWEVSGPITPDGWRPVIGCGYESIDGIDFSTLKEGEVRSFHIGSFAKGGN